MSAAFDVEPAPLVGAEKLPGVDSATRAYPLPATSVPPDPVSVGLLVNKATYVVAGDE